MSKYATAQEYRLKRYFENHPDVEVIEYYGSRTKNAGDFLIKIGKHQVRVDHKSTIKDDKVRIMKKWLPGLQATCLDRQEKEGQAIPLITISSKKHRAIWALSTRHEGLPSVSDTKRIRSGAKETSFNTGWLYDLGSKLGKIDCDGYFAYIRTLTRFIEEIKDGY